MNRKFDCVEMKHKAAAKIQKETGKMSRKEELAFWKKKYEEMKAAKRTPH
jgi:hypothetical protein